MQLINRRQVLKGIGAGSTVGIASMAGCSGDGGDGGDGGGDGGDGGSGGSGGSTGSPGSTLEMTIASATSLSGPFAPNGEAEVSSGEVAIRRLEDELDVSLELVTGDTEVNPSTGVERLERMVVEDGAHVAYGGVSSAVAVAVGSWANDNQVPYLPHGVSDDLTGAECGPYMFSPYMSNSMMVNVVDERMAEMEDDWFLIYSDYTWGQTANETYTENLEENGANVVDSVAAPFPSEDYTQYLNAAADSDATGLACLVAGLDQRTIMSQIMDLGLNEEFTIQFHQNEDVNFWGLSKEASNAIEISSQGWSPALDVPDDWTQDILENGQHDPYVRHVMGYTSVDQLVRAAVRAGSTDGGEIIEELSGHEVESESVLALHEDPDTMYWREADHQLITPVYATRGLPVEDMQDDPYSVWFEVIDSIPGDEASPEPNPECDIDN